MTIVHSFLQRDIKKQVKSKHGITAYKRQYYQTGKKRNRNTKDALAGELWDKRHGRVARPWGFPVVSGIKPVAIDLNHSVKRIQ